MVLNFQARVVRNYIANARMKGASAGSEINDEALDGEDSPFWSHILVQADAKHQLDKQGLAAMVHARLAAAGDDGSTEHGARLPPWILLC
jgi:hypothetical protein